MILKVLLVVVVIAVVYIMFIKKRPQVTKTTKKKDELKSNDMVECVTCEIYCELDSALVSGGKYFCSQECLEKAS